MITSRACIGVLVGGVGVWASGSAAGQCLEEWTSPPGVEGQVLALAAWDPDGPLGPQSPFLVAGGRFPRYPWGSVATYRFGWSGAFGQGLASGGETRAFAEFNGRLVAGGMYTMSGVPEPQPVAEFDGVVWRSLDFPRCQIVPRTFALAADVAGLIVGGSFTTSVPAPMLSNIARYDGQAWSAPARADGLVSSLLIVSDQLYAGGTLSLTPPINIARLDGGEWLPLAGGVDLPPLAMTVFQDELIVGGDLTIAGGAAVNRVAAWDGTSWRPLGPGFDAAVRSLHVHHDELFAGGDFTSSGGTPMAHVARWNGAAWQPLGSGIAGGLGQTTVSAMTTFQDGLVVGGTFTMAGSGPAVNIGLWRCLTPPVECRVNCTGDTDPFTGRPRLNVLDFTCFQGAFALGDLTRADLGGVSGCEPDGRLSITDFICFQNLFSLGCR